MLQSESQENNNNKLEDNIALDGTFIRCKMLTNGVLRIEIEFEDGIKSRNAFKNLCEPMARLAVVRIKE